MVESLDKANRPRSVRTLPYVVLTCVCVCVCVAGDGEETRGGAERDRVSQDDPAKSPRLPQVTQSQLKLSPFHSLTSSIKRVLLIIMFAIVSEYQAKLMCVCVCCSVG